jgi:hypothetical protein
VLYLDHARKMSASGSDTGTVRRQVLWVKLVPVFEDRPVSSDLDAVDEDARIAAVDRLHGLVSGGSLSLEGFSAALEKVLAALTNTDLKAAMLALPPLVRLTPAPLRLAQPLVLRADGGLKLGSGWQLAADTTVSVAFGAAVLDLTAASWDAYEVNLRLETQAGAIEVVVPEGVAVQMVGGSGRVQLESLSPPVPGGPILRVSTSGPTGVIRVHHPKRRAGGPLAHWRRRRTASRPSSGR